MHVNHKKNALCDGYVIEFSYDPTESYYERGKCGYINFHLMKFPLFMLLQSLRISRGGSLSPSQKLAKAFADELSF